MCAKRNMALHVVCVNTKQTAAVGHCIAISEEVNHGLGQHQASVDSQTLNDYYIVGQSMQLVLCSRTAEKLMSPGCICFSDLLHFGDLGSQTCRPLLFHQFNSSRQEATHGSGCYGIHRCMGLCSYTCCRISMPSTPNMVS